jgi:carbamate kinase
MLVVAALGGNALLRRGEVADATTQQRNIEIAAAALARIAAEHDLVVTHGNGPQIGLQALQAAAYKPVEAFPLDVLGAESEGMIGCMLERGFVNALPGARTATLLTQVVVDASDPAFAAPSKPIGPGYSRAAAHRLARQRGWYIARDGDQWRRVVATPEPQLIIELAAIRTLVKARTIVICTGGGGIPVAVDDSGAITGIEAVVDKDLSAALLAEQLQADALLLLTDVRAIHAGWRSAHPRPIRHANPDKLEAMRLPAGSMGPKARAAARFVRNTGKPAAIGALADAPALLRGTAGTRVVAPRATSREVAELQESG